MPSFPEFLPPMFDLSEGWNLSTIEELYQIFKKDFIDRPLYYRRVVVKIDNRKIDSDKEEAFWHIITRTDQRTKQRLPNFERARRLPWVRAIIEHPDAPEILEWKYLEYVKGYPRIRIYLWLERFDFVVILEEKENEVFLVTAYYVEGESTCRRLRAKYNKRL